jgi:hypothetical protein
MFDLSSHISKRSWKILSLVISGKSKAKYDFFSKTDEKSLYTSLLPEMTVFCLQNAIQLTDVSLKS